MWGPISKIARAKWAGGVAQAVECHLCKHEALSSTPSPAKKKIFSLSRNSIKIMLTDIVRIDTYFKKN
jgi:hypothetical protein